MRASRFCSSRVGGLGPNPLCGRNDRRLWEYYLPATSLAGGNDYA